MANISKHALVACFSDGVRSAFEMESGKILAGDKISSPLEALL